MNRKRVSLLIDADNISAAAANTVLSVATELGDLCVRRIYGDFSKKKLQNGAKFVKLMQSFQFNSLLVGQVRTRRILPW